MHDLNWIDSSSCRYLKNQNATGENDEYKVKLKQVETDWPAYKKLILGEKMTEAEKVSSVFVNYRYFVEKLSEWKKEGHNPFDLLDKGLLLFSVITIELKPVENTWENPQEIFESMNSIGKPLSLADLVRNHLLFGEKPKRQDELYKKHWLVMEQSVPQRVSGFVRDFMQLRGKCSYPVTSEGNHKRLYQDFKLLFASTQSESMLKELAEYSKTYALILGAD